MTSLEEKVDSLIEDVREVKTALKGYNGQIGLCKQVENNARAINKIWITLAVIIASCGGGTYGLIQLFGG